MSEGTSLYCRGLNWEFVWSLNADLNLGESTFNSASHDCVYGGGRGSTKCCRRCHVNNRLEFWAPGTALTQPTKNWQIEHIWLYSGWIAKIEAHHIILCTLYMCAILQWRRFILHCLEAFYDHISGQTFSLRWHYQVQHFKKEITKTYIINSVI